MIEYIDIPDLLWEKFIRAYPRSSLGFVGDILLKNHQNIEKLVVSSKGRILGRIIDQMPQSDGMIDKALLTFASDDIKGIRLANKKWFRSRKWVTL